MQKRTIFDFSTNLIVLKDHLIDISSTGSIKDTRLLVSNFLTEWSDILVDLEFLLDMNGDIVNGPLSMPDYQKNILREYIILRCLNSALANDEFKLDNINYCHTQWENENAPDDLNAQCEMLLNVVSVNLKSSAS